MNNTVKQIMHDIDHETEPFKMSKEKAVEVLEEVIDEIRSRIECLKEEMQNEE